MLEQINIYGKDKVQVAIERLQMFEPPEGYYLAFSGGKDSVCIKALADMAGVKYDAHYNLTSADPPELVQFIKTFTDVSIDIPRDKDGKQITMWNLIPRKLMPPTRIVRYCCKELKEGGGKGRFSITGVRHAESVKRKNNRAGLEIDTGKPKRVLSDPDNPSNEEMVRICPIKGGHILNPIIDWGNDDVWSFIHKYNVPYCELYDKGHKRLGCIGCPMNTHNASELENFPKYKQAYLRAFERMLAVRKEKGLETEWKTGEDVMKWWTQS